MASHAVVTAEVPCITPNGRAGKVPAGTYQVVEIDGAAERHVAYIVVTGGDLVCVSTTDARVQVEPDREAELTNEELDEMLRRGLRAGEPPPPTQVELDASFAAAMAAATAPPTMTRVVELQTGARIVTEQFGYLTVTQVWADPSLDAPEDVYVDVRLDTWSHRWDPDDLPAEAGAQGYGYLGLDPPRYRLRYLPGDEVPIH